MSKKFKRIEEKFALSKSEYEYLKKNFPVYLEKDTNYLYKVSSLYFDTEDFQFTKDNIRKNSYKEKFRIRKYGDTNTSVFLEIKRKFQGITDKRRIEIKEEEVQDYLSNIQTYNRTFNQEEEEYIYNEIQWLFRRLELQPKVYIHYLREAYIDKENNVRLTFDKNIKYRTTDLDILECFSNDKLVAPEIDYLMEIKTPSGLPKWLEEILTELNIKKVEFSKYKQVYQRHIQG